MNILRKLTSRDIALNKKRSIVTIIGIILSTSLICAVAGMFISFQASSVNYAYKTDGNFHTAFLNVEQKNLKYFENNREIDKYFTYESLGYSRLKNSYNKSKPYLHIMNFSKDALKNMGLFLEEGRMPTSDEEIVISQTIIKDAKVNFEIGQTLTLEIGNRINDEGVVLTQNNMIILNDEGEILEEKIENIYTKTYTIVGIINRPTNIIEPYSAPGYSVITTETNTKGALTVAVKFMDVKDTYDLSEEINAIIKKDIIYNSEPLRWSGVSKNDEMLTTLYGLIGIIIFIIIFASVFVIRNSFAISSTEKMKQYGMLASIGATKKQIRSSVFWEAFILGIIGIPLGLICGMFAVFVLVIFTKSMIGDFFATGFDMIYRVPVSILLLTSLLAAITILFSSLASAIRASRVSPIEAIRNNKDIKIKAKKIRSPKFIKRIFGVGGDIAYKNLKRNKKKYRTTVISLVVSITIFISLSSFIKYSFGMMNDYYADCDYNIQVIASLDTNKHFEEIVKMDHINMYSIQTEKYLMTDLHKYFTKEGKKALQVENNQFSTNFISLGDKAYFKFLKDLKLSYEEASKGLIYVIPKEFKNSSEFLNKKEMKQVNVQVDEKEIGFDIIKVTDKTAFGLDFEYYPTGYFIVSDELMKTFPETITTVMNIDSDNADKLTDDIEALKITDLSIVNLDKILRSNRRITQWISVFLYGFIIVISLIGVTNIFNTITTNMNLRSKEFAMLKSIGMSKKEFNKMIRLESVFYGMKSLIIGIILGLGLSYLMYFFVDKSFVSSSFIIPYPSIIIAIIFIFIVVSLIMRYSLNKINRQNIIETIRNDNI